MRWQSVLVGVIFSSFIGIGCDITTKERAYQNIILDQKLLIKYQQQQNLSKQQEILKDLILCAEYLNLDSSFYKRELDRVKRAKIAKSNPETANSPAIISPNIQKLKGSVAPIDVEESTHYPVSKVIKLSPSKYLAPSSQIEKNETKTEKNLKQNKIPDVMGRNLKREKSNPTQQKNSSHRKTLAQLDRKIEERELASAPKVSPFPTYKNKKGKRVGDIGKNGELVTNPVTTTTLSKKRTGKNEKNGNTGQIEGRGVPKGSSDRQGKFAKIVTYSPKFRILFPTPVLLNHFTIKGKPYREVFDLTGGKVEKPIKRSFKKGIVLKIAQFKPNLVRIVFQSDTPFQMCGQLVENREFRAVEGKCHLPTQNLDKKKVIVIEEFQ